MRNENMVLTQTDHLILESYRRFLDGLSDYLGSGVEIVLHSLENLDQSVVKIINGHITGRSEGAPVTNLALTMLSRIELKQSDCYVTYFGTNHQGDPIKSSTIAIFGENNRIIGLICMNFYLNISLSSLLGEFAGAYAASAPETFSNNIDDTIEKAVTDTRCTVISDNSVAQGHKNKEIILQLKEQGIFQLKDAVPKVAALLEISKNTVYMHLRNDK